MVFLFVYANNTANLQLYRHNSFHTEVSSNVIHAPSACLHVYIHIFQSAQMTLIGSIEDVLARQIERKYTSAMTF